jgi:signal transduction histidine kinase/CheY-like chemotaxis protein
VSTQIGSWARDRFQGATRTAEGRSLVARGNLLFRLLILVAAATLPAVLVLIYLQHDLRSEGRARLGDEALRQAELLNADMTNVVEGARQLSLAITHFVAVQDGDPSCRRNLADLRGDLPSYALLSVVAEDGQVICTTDANGPEWANAATIAHVREVIESGNFDVGTYMPASPEHGAIVPFCEPFTTTAGRHMVVIVGLSLDWLGQHLGELKRPADSTIGIADRNGVTIARYPDHDKWVGKLFPPPVRPYINAQHRGNAVVMGYDGMERLIGFVPATEKPVHMFVSIGMFLPGMLAAIDNATLKGTILIAVGAVLSLLFALVIGDRFVRRPTAALLAAARRWSTGDLSARAELHESSRSEFGSLALAFNNMAEAFGRQRAELQELNTSLEGRVAERTRELTDSRNRLQVEMSEREKSEANLRQAQKLQAVGHLAGGVAHDFNNLLTAVVGALDLIRGRLAGGQEGLVRLVDNALHAAERGSKLTSQLLAFSRRQRLLPSPTDLNMTVVALSNLLGSALGRSIRIQTDLVQDLWPAMVDPSQIEAAILNLAINARDAMPEGGVLTIATRNVTLPASGSAAAGDYVAVRVTDTGTGMSPEVVARVFEPFFTTKEPGRGSGLGLSQVHGLAVQSGGDVRIDSKVGDGTTVTLLVPRARTLPLMARPEPMAGRGAAKRRARVLVVDDDRDVRQMTGEMLTERGYAVELAADGQEALAILERDSNFDVMLVDYVMPGINGVALMQTARTLYPQMKSLLMTGHAEMRSGEIIGSESILRKPFNVATLDDRLDRLFARPVLRAVQGGVTDVA